MTYMMIFNYKLVTYLSNGDVASLQNASVCGSCRDSRVNVCALQFLGRIGLGLVFRLSLEHGIITQVLLKIV